MTPIIENERLRASKIGAEMSSWLSSCNILNNHY